ncbi:hypothetical protein HYU45_00075 [Candidatus Daviesbacteria bacterium]|nr:hypothetical protein [Candidatus Levybacteria bacterium]MBI2195994.1 hypothetical protein [Candidatus Daviesbacteria bacterium]MBI2622483.1 hypothetical protein [Candidatus Levybacteria bacterium]MBI3092626.1 hypothetical protein [Candidatus Levybacteria bacterium]
MKRKDGNSQLVTTKILQGELFSFEARIDSKLEKLEQRVDDRAQQYRDQILTSNDKLAKTLEIMREELEIGNFQMKRRVDNHEKRIAQLEKVQTA